MQVSKLSTVRKSCSQVRWPQIRTRKSFKLVWKHILLFKFWWQFIINSHIYMNISQYNTFWMKMKKSRRVFFWYCTNFNITRIQHRAMQIPDRLSLVLKKNPFAQSIFILPVLKTITNLVKYPKLIETHSFQRQIFSLLICSFLSE